MGERVLLKPDWDPHYDRVRGAIREVAQRVWGIALSESFDEFRPPGHPRIVFDVYRRFGDPYVEGCYIRSDVLYDLYVAEKGDAEAVADWHEVDVEDVMAAVAFHEAHPDLFKRRKD